MRLKFTMVLYDEAYCKDGNKTLLKLLSRAGLTNPQLQPLNEKSFGKRVNFQESVRRVFVEGDFKVTGALHRVESHQAYEAFIRAWSQTLKSVKPYMGHQELAEAKSESSPWILLKSDKAFAYRLDSSHERIPISFLKFGSLLNWSHFACHAHFQTAANEGDADSCHVSSLEASFFHDTKQGEIIVDEQYALRYKYSGVREVVVEAQPEGSGAGLTIYLVLVNPPSVVECQEMTSVKTRDLNPLTYKAPLFYGQTVLTVPGLHEDVLGRSNCLAIGVPDVYTARNVISRLHFRSGKRGIAYAVMDTRHVPAPKGFPDLDIGHFDCTYALTALVRRRFALQLQNAHDEMKELLRDLRNCAGKSPFCLYSALEEVLQLMDEGVLLDYGQVILDLFHSYYVNVEKLEKDHEALPRNTKKVWRVVVTPTRLMLYPAEEIFGNRVIRQFSCSHALRVSFRDDSFQRLSRVANYCSDEYINAVILNQMEEGLTIGRRHYEFLGWSNSQLRDHGVYMYAKDELGNTAASIRKWMGDFSSIKNVPKFMARMGQCFSHTEPTVAVALNSSRVATVPDVEGGRNPANGKPYCFSDGVGRVSLDLMKQAAEVVGYNYVPSAIQFRLAGYKGMLTLDPTLKEYDIVFRQSQLKFPCDVSDKLEVVSKSTATALQLNKQLITILDQKGVPAAVFLDLQQEMLRELTEMLFVNDKAAKYLSTHSAMPGIDYKALASAGFGLNNEAFFRNILLAQHRVALDGIKEKARLDLDPSLARNMFGIMDETGILEYGQVFVQFTTDISENADRSHKTVHVGKVMVTKNPCLQLGDVRIFEAIDVPELSHIVDCIVFPSRGPRPHPSEMAGSDLDGDEYAVIWKEELFFEGGNDEASIFPIPKQEVIEGEIRVRDMLLFLKKYIMNDRLGVIANAHLARADDPEIGLRHPICWSIARKFSIAVDFAKNGQEVKLAPEERPEKYPDFMEKGSHANTYKSKRVLGRLYRICKEYEEENRISTETRFKIEIDQDLVLPGFEKYAPKAQAACQKYRRVLGSLLSHYGIESDYEACGKALTKTHCRLERQERLDIEEVLTKNIQHMWKVFENEFAEEFQSISANDERANKAEYSEEELMKASAYYVIAYKNPKKYFLSFPWIVWKRLLAIKKARATRIVHNPYIARIDQELDAWLVNNELEPLSDVLKTLCRNNIKKSVKPLSFVDTYQLEVALQILLRWGIYSSVIGADEKDPDVGVLKREANYLQRDVRPALEGEGKSVPRFYFARVFFMSVKNYKRTPRVMELVLDFFCLCISLRFVTNTNNGQSHNHLKKHKYLGKKAMSTYHSLAVGSGFGCLGLRGGEAPYDVIEETEMDPVRVQALLVKDLSADHYAPLQSYLKKESGVSSVSVRPLKQHLLISAKGTKLSHQLLKKTLYKMSTK